MKKNKTTLMRYKQALADVYTPISTKNTAKLAAFFTEDLLENLITSLRTSNKKVNITRENAPKTVEFSIILKNKFSIPCIVFKAYSKQQKLRSNTLTRFSNFVHEVI